MPRPKFNQLRRKLLDWYKTNHRDLPWRRRRDPYAIWIAETMLQQTQVKTALPYYARFIEAFPTIAALDRAPKQKVLAVWSGLGYYRRAENLKRAARIIARKHQGELPRAFDTLYALPGIGTYTAGALMSIAFNRAYPALDGNARRVLGRLFNSGSERELEEFGKRALSRSNPGQFNQALMELGATVCVAPKPHCASCPLSRWCAARQSANFRLAGPSGSKRGVQKVQWPLLVIQNNGRILLRRRPQDGLLGGLWEVPGGERKKGETPRGALLRHLNGLEKAAKGSLLVGEVSHSITYRRIQAPVFLLTRFRKKLRRRSRWRWASLSSLQRYPLSSLSLKAIKLATER